MEKPQEIYRQKITRFKAKLKKSKQQLFVSSMLRLAAFLGIVLSIYLFWGQVFAVVLSLVLGIVLFIFLVSRHTTLTIEKNRLTELLKINERELEVLQGNYHHLPSGKKYLDPQHEFSQDIDLFGKGSFFQYLNRTALPESEAQLAALLLANQIEGIPERQAAIQDLTDKIDFRQEFSAQAALAIEEKIESQLDVQESLKALQEHSFFVPKFGLWISWIFSLLSLGVILAFSFDKIGLPILLIWLFIGLGITGIYAKRVNLLSAKVSKMQRIFRQYHKLLLLLENTSFSSALMQSYKTQISGNSTKASETIRTFSKTIDALDQRNNLVFGFIGNGFLLWDIWQSAKLEKWIKANGKDLNDWFKVIAETDAYNSIGNFAFNHPAYTYPILTSQKAYIKALDAVHPLIPEKQAVTNSFEIQNDEFFIITGANMAGKSTFLRTVALQIMMSNVGLPVRATACEYTPIKLITSMRTVDSLTEESSYFYAELSRLKFIIDQLKKDRYFIVLDEILKGTNSTDKAIGSRKFLQKLVKSNATGLIATHDLSLCAVAEEMTDVKNYYFDAQIIDDELYFDYKFKPGICQNMNASFLLKKMEIVDD